MAENNEKLEINGAIQDTEIDVAALIRTAKPEKEVSEPVEAVEETKVSKVLSPLEQMKLDQESGSKGVVVETEDLIRNSNSGEKKLMASIYDSHLEERLKESDELIEKRSHVVLLKVTETEEDYIKAMNELSSLKLNEETNTYYFDYKDREGKPKTPEFFRIRTVN